MRTLRRSVLGCRIAAFALLATAVACKKQTATSSPPNGDTTKAAPTTLTPSIDSGAKLGEREGGRGTATGGSQAQPEKAMEGFAAAMKPVLVSQRRQRASMYHDQQQKY